MLLPGAKMNCTISGLEILSTFSQASGEQPACGSHGAGARNARIFDVERNCERVDANDRL